MKGRLRDWVTLLNPPYCWNGWRAADYAAQGSYLLRVVEEAATWCIPNMGLRPSPGYTYACHMYAPEGCGNANPKH